MQDSFGESGSYDALKKKYKLDKESVKKALEKALKHL
jgi:transketolase C-terminal domain/subunit